MLFFATGEYLQEVSVRRSREAISEGANLVPSVAHLLTGHCALSDKSGNLRSDFQSLTPSKLLQSSLDNPLFSSQILECPGKPNAEFKENSESKTSLDSRFNNSDSESSPIVSESKKALESSSTDSKTITQSPTSKNLNKALPNTNNSACVSTSLAQLQNCAIFATQKSNKMCRCDSTNRHSPASWCAIVEKRRQQCLRNDCARSGKSEALPPKDILCGCRKDPTG